MEINLKTLNMHVEIVVVFDVFGINNLSFPPKYGSETNKKSV